MWQFGGSNDTKKKKTENKSLPAGPLEPCAPVISNNLILFDSVRYRETGG